MVSDIPAVDGMEKLFYGVFSFAPSASLPAASSLARMTSGSVAMEKPLQSETSEGEEKLI